MPHTPQHRPAAVPVTSSGPIAAAPAPVSLTPTALPPTPVPANFDDLQRQAIEELFANPGLGNLEASRNLVRGDASTAIRDRALRRGSQSASRGLFGSGLLQRDLRGIEQDVGQQEARALNDLEELDSRLRQAGFATGLQAIEGIENLDLQELLGKEGLRIQELLGRLGVGASRFATRSNLELGQLGIQNQQQQFEFLQNFLLGQLPGAGVDQVTGGPIDLSELIGNFTSPVGGEVGIPGGELGPVLRLPSSPRDF